jgi:hypothetical protein
MDTKTRGVLAGALALALAIAGVGVGIASSRNVDTHRATTPQQPNPQSRASATQPATIADESDDAQGADDTHDKATPITGSALRKASEAALAYLAQRDLQGRVSETEAGDQESYYEVEVTLDSGRQLDVHLDRDFNVLRADGDGSGQDD